MKEIKLPQGYKPLLSIYETQRAIDLGNRLFADKLAGALRLHRVSAPLFVSVASGLNDDLNGVERAVAFDINGVEGDAAVVHSLAKWKRLALKRYQFQAGEGLYTDMNAIRRDETLDSLHSAYVDQWDWEKIIAPEDRNLDCLKGSVRAIAGALAEVQDFLHTVFPQLSALPKLEREVAFVTAQELEDRYPRLTPKEREDVFTRDHPVTVLMGIPTTAGPRTTTTGPSTATCWCGTAWASGPLSCPPWASGWTPPPWSASCGWPAVRSGGSCPSTGCSSTGSCL